MQNKNPDVTLKLKRLAEITETKVKLSRVRTYHTWKFPL